MIRQNIKVALFSVLFLVLFWLIMFSFVKIDIGTKAVITFDESYSYLVMDDKSGAYIENNEIDYIKIEYKQQYFNCHITYSSSGDESTYFLISLPDIFDKTKNYYETNTIIDSLNLYQYWMKK